MADVPLVGAVAEAAGAGAAGLDTAAEAVVVVAADEVEEVAVAAAGGAMGPVAAAATMAVAATVAAAAMVAVVATVAVAVTVAAGAVGSDSSDSWLWSKSLEGGGSSLVGGPDAVLSSRSGDQARRSEAGMVLYAVECTFGGALAAAAPTRFSGAADFLFGTGIGVRTVT